MGIVPILIILFAIVAIVSLIALIYYKHKNHSLPEAARTDLSTYRNATILFAVLTVVFFLIALGLHFMWQDALAHM
jgi:sorbitol-specific phosphotransferase system component IIC